MVVCVFVWVLIFFLALEGMLFFPLERSVKACLSLLLPACTKGIVSKVANALYSVLFFTIGIIDPRLLP